MHFYPRNKKFKTLAWPAWTLLTILFFSSHAAAQEACGEMDREGQFGPFDYTNAEDRANLPIVENYHFGPEVQKLKPGRDTGGDLDYTLRAFPNHHRALERMIEFSLQSKALTPPGAHYSIHCYFDRALRQKPDDGIVYMLWGNYLAKTNKPQDALKKYQEAVRLLPDNGNVNYNAGLFYFNQKDYELAYQHAKKAYDAGFPLQGLKNKLQKAGKWREG